LTDNTVRHIERSNGTLKSLFLMLGALNRRLPLRGADVEELRHQRKISARKFAMQIGITRPTLVALERHDTGRVETLLDAYGALNVTPRLLPNSGKVEVQNLPDNPLGFQHLQSVVI
jgi:transcriptional regulator with XRE-family HTH domain